MVEKILVLRYPKLPVLEIIGSLGQSLATMEIAQQGFSSPLLDKIQAERQALLSLSATELARTHEREAERVEAGHFFNRPDAGADFTHWARMDFWTLEESVALLLGKNPEKVSWKKMKGYDASPFVIGYGKLLKLAERSEVMSQERLPPADVIAWAEQTGAVTPPADLCELIAPRVTENEAAAGLSGSHAGTDAAEAPGGTGAKWSPERLAELAAYRAARGTKEAAIRFGITSARVRKLLPRAKPPAAPAAIKKKAASFFPTPD